MNIPENINQVKNSCPNFSLEQEFKLLIDNMPGGLLYLCDDEPWTILYMSDNLLSLFGYDRDDLSTLFCDRYTDMVCAEDLPELREEISQQMQQGESFELSYRVTKKNGEYIWLLSRGKRLADEHGKRYFYCVLIDITETKAAQAALAESHEQYRMIADLTHVTVFEYDIKTQAFKLTPSSKDHFISNYTKTTSMETTFNHDTVYADDLPLMQEWLATLLTGVDYYETELRLKQENTSYAWYSFQGTTTFDMLGCPAKIIAKISNIDQKKLQEESLKRLAQRDPLTLLYNKNSVESKIREVLSPNLVLDSQHALMVVDVDNFKEINDTYGHLYGDEVLKQIADSLSSRFRTSDVVGRIGGDEFIVFMENIPSRELAEQKASAVISAIADINPDKNSPGTITCSVGISFFPEDGQNFRMLFSHADSALYTAKHKGKNQFQIYDECNVGEHYVVQMENSRLEPTDHVESNIIHYIFKVLYESTDFESAVSMILGIAGKHYEVSRAYVFENSEDGLTCSNTFEWCNTGIEPQITQLKNISYSELGSFKDILAENGFFHSSDINNLDPGMQDILAPQGIHSLLHCAIMDSGQSKGYVGFDECVDQRLWTKDEIATLAFISKILSVFLIKGRIAGKLAQAYRVTQSVLNAQDMFIYAIDRDTHELIFVNHKTTLIAPHTKLSNTCYASFFGREVPCEQCPLTGIDDTHDNCTMEIYNPTLHVWTAATASKMEWSGRNNACLLSCFDITYYKHTEGH